MQHDVLHWKVCVIFSRCITAGQLQQQQPVTGSEGAVIAFTTCEAMKLVTMATVCLEGREISSQYET